MEAKERTWKGGVEKKQTGVTNKTSVANLDEMSVSEGTGEVSDSYLLVVVLKISTEKY